MNEEPRELGGDVGGSAEEGVYDVDSVAEMFAEEEAAEDGGNQPWDEGEEGEEPAGPQAEAPDEGEQDAASDIPRPEGFEEALWQGMTPEVRSAVHAREEAHAQAAAQAEQERHAARQQQERFAVAANAQIQQALATMKQIVEGEYGGVDWNGLAQSDPATCIKLQQAYNARMGAIQRVQQGVAQAANLYEAQRAQEAQKMMASEFAQVQPEIRALMGAGFDSRTFASDVAKYMQEQGCPPEVVNGLSRGYEVKFVAKAMLYDRMQARRASAAKKVAEAPRVQSPRGAAQADAGDRAKRARALLSRNPNSTDALAALFEAEM